MRPRRLDVQRYLALRRGLGFKLKVEERHLGRFVSFLAERGALRITPKLAIEFATEHRELSRGAWVQRFSAVRAFAQYWHGFDPETEVPPSGLLRCPKKRARPRICTEAEIEQLLEATRAVRPSRVHGLKPATVYALLGLLIVTGLRIGEALRLQSTDVDWQSGLLRIRETKFGKSRLVPLHSSTLRQLKRYARLRDAFLARTNRPAAPRFFVTNRGTPVSDTNMRSTFRNLVRNAGLCEDSQPLPRLHDLRHRFAVETLRRWYLSGQDVEQRLPSLSTYLGHVNVEATYWYLSCTPELRAAAVARVESRWKGVA
jgi:integrase/recombinase XerD